MDKEQALNSFWNGFDLVAYDESSVPEDAILPYITYSVSVDEFLYPVSLTASIWYRSTSWEAITKKLNQISNEIGKGGKMVPYEGGSIWIKKGSPFAQRMTDSDSSIRRIFMNIEAEFIN